MRSTAMGISKTPLGAGLATSVGAAIGAKAVLPGVQQ
ncbi:hypothetical protein D934_01385 [Xylella fastidiosa subsp. sandyi Ann-1]|uniref:Uncharacterized protein n=1 Tax=Xylella fastidiosa subsp. sandyi Ann-1 TaxID=155920 RepID=A0A060HDI2_XYLFS|nr:hypothetical protein D934_01385 [Xylella fastidiosa subsp. sandyi Ann-1]